MTLTKTLATLDEAALIAATSKGVFKQAQKQLDKETPSILDQGDDLAKLLLAGETIELSAKGIQAATCTCPA